MFSSSDVPEIGTDEKTGKKCLVQGVSKAWFNLNQFNSSSFFLSRVISSGFRLF